MSNVVQLQATSRRETGKGVARKLRRSGQIPGVVYGSGAPMPMQLEERELRRVGQGAGLIELVLDGKPQTVLVRAIQTEPVTGDPLHVDFQVVAMDQELSTQVPIRVVGEDRRPSDGGMIIQVLRELPIKALPRNLPEALDVDVSGVAVGESITVADMKLPEGVSTEHDPADVVVSVMLAQKVSTATADEDEAAEGEAAESGER